MVQRQGLCWALAGKAVQGYRFGRFFVPIARHACKTNAKKIRYITRTYARSFKPACIKNFFIYCAVM